MKHLTYESIFLIWIKNATITPIYGVEMSENTKKRSPQRKRAPKGALNTVQFSLAGKVSQ
jgi:hypothetical protein